MPSPAEQPSAPRPSKRRAIWRYGGIAAGVALVAGIAFDAWYSRHLVAEARNEVARSMGPTASALRTAIERRIALLEGLRSFVDRETSRARLDEEFPAFAEGLAVNATGMRTLQLVEDGIIVATWPLVGNERALGYNLMTDPRPAISRDLLRSLETDSVVITGPIELLQGGEGLIVRRRLLPREGFPQVAALVLDIGPISREAGLPDPRLGLLLEVRDRSGQWFGGDAFGSAIEPETVTVSVPDGDWTLLGAPAGGWAAFVATERNATRSAIVGFGLALVVLSLMLGSRQTQMATVLAGRTARLDVALKAGHMGTWEFDMARQRMSFDANGAAILGRSVSEASGSVDHIMTILHPEDASFVAKVFLESVRSDRSEYTLEHRVVLPDGSERWVLVQGEIVRDKSGKPLAAQGIIADASDRRATETRARQTERVETIGTMAGGVAHDFNNLLTAIVSFTELARDGLETRRDAASIEAARDDLNEALKAAGRAKGLTAQLLAFSKGTASEPRRTELPKMLTDLEPLLRRLLGQRITLTMRVEPAVPKVWIDPSQFTQVVLNLIVNARDAITERGEVVLRLRTLASSEPRPLGCPAGSWVLLEISDTGSGMTDEVRERLFEPYFTTKKAARGTGLGLSVVHGVVRAAGGHAVVESALGSGTTFWILLPPLDASGNAGNASGGIRRDTPSGGLALLR